MNKVCEQSGAAMGGLSHASGGMQVVNRYIDQGTAELVPGVLFIDEVRGSAG